MKLSSREGCVPGFRRLDQEKVRTRLGSHVGLWPPRGVFIGRASRDQTEIPLVDGVKMACLTMTNRPAESEFFQPPKL